jgi:hypothetical protein
VQKGGVQLNIRKVFLMFGILRVYVLIYFRTQNLEVKFIRFQPMIVKVMPLKYIT